MAKEGRHGAQAHLLRKVPEVVEPTAPQNCGCSSARRALPGAIFICETEAPWLQGCLIGDKLGGGERTDPLKAPVPLPAPGLGSSCPRAWASSPANRGCWQGNCLPLLQDVQNQSRLEGPPAALQADH